MDRSQNTQSGSEFDEDETEELELDRKITVGICAMNKKVILFRQILFIPERKSQLHP